MSKKTAASKPKPNRRTSMKATRAVAPPPHDPIRALGEWMDGLGRLDRLDKGAKGAQKGAQTRMKRKKPQCRIIVVIAEGSPQQVTELLVKAKELKVFS
jgi:hypothetical protein